MTKYLFHGDNQAGSRDSLLTAIAAEKKKGVEIQTIDGQKVTPKDLESALNSINLFSQNALVIENLASRLLSNDKKKAISLIKEYGGDKNIYIWEKKELTKTQVGAFGKDVVAKVAKTPAIIFKFLDALTPGGAKTALQLLHETHAQAEDGFIFVMFARHIADLIIAKSGDTSRLIPFKRSRLISQADHFSDLQLISIHSQLLDIDRKIKTGNTKLSYIDQLDLLLVGLLN